MEIDGLKKSENFFKPFPPLLYPFPMIPKPPNLSLKPFPLYATFVLLWTSYGKHLFPYPIFIPIPAFKVEPACFALWQPKTLDPAGMQRPFYHWKTLVLTVIDRVPVMVKCPDILSSSGLTHSDPPWVGDTTDSCHLLAMGRPTEPVAFIELVAYFDRLWGPQWNNSLVYLPSVYVATKYIFQYVFVGNMVYAAERV